LFIKQKTAEYEEEGVRPVFTVPTCVFERGWPAIPRKDIPRSCEIPNFDFDFDFDFQIPNKTEAMHEPAEE